MGYLSSSFMKSFAIRMKIKAENRLMSLTMQASHAKRNLDLKQNQLTSQQKFQEITFTQRAGQEVAALQASMQGLIGADGKITDQNQYNQLQTSIFQTQQNAQWQKQQASLMFNLWMEQESEPLRAISERLEIEKTQAQQDADFWKQTLEAYNSKVKEDMKGIIPDAG